MHYLENPTPCTIWSVVEYTKIRRGNISRTFRDVSFDVKFGDIFARFRFATLHRPILGRLPNFVESASVTTGGQERERGAISFRDNLIIEAFGNAARYDT